MATSQNPALENNKMWLTKKPDRGKARETVKKKMIRSNIKSYRMSDWK